MSTLPLRAAACSSEPCLSVWWCRSAPLASSASSLSQAASTTMSRRQAGPSSSQCSLWTGQSQYAHAQPPDVQLHR
eukprot:21256-Heterococcus_DN1.PRE.1